jgi:hypothetical protein
MNMLKAINGTLIRDVEAEDTLPLTLQIGDRVREVEAPRPRPGYFWADDGSFCSGWVPEAVVDRRGGEVKARAEYCSAHLSASTGDVVRVLWRGQGFDAVWCENRDGDRGWIPGDALAIDPTDLSGLV